MRRIIVAVIVLAILVIGGMRVYQAKHRTQSETAKDIQARMGIPVETVAVRRGEIESRLMIYGMLKGKSEVPVSAKVGGRAMRVLVDNGQRVRAGQLLIQLETKEIQDHVNQAQAAVNGARQQVALVRKGARPQERSQVENLTEQARQAFETAQNNLNRMKTLLAAGVISQQQFDTIKLNYDMAKTGYDNAKEQLSIVRVGARDEEKRMAEEGLNQAEAALAFAREQLKNAAITAPISGVVSSRIIDPGTLVGTQMPFPLMTIVDDTAFELNADIPETDLSKVRVGQSVEIAVDAIPGKKYEGTVTDINPAASMGARTYTLKVMVRNSDGLMKSGMFARGNVTVAQKADAIVIPKDAVRQTAGNYSVYVVEGDKAVLRPVEMGIINTTKAECVKGLSEGEQIVTTGVGNIKAGDKVHVVKKLTR